MICFLIRKKLWNIFLLIIKAKQKLKNDYIANKICIKVLDFHLQSLCHFKEFSRNKIFFSGYFSFFFFVLEKLELELWLSHCFQKAVSSSIIKVVSHFEMLIAQFSENCKKKKKLIITHHEFGMLWIFEKLSTNDFAKNQKRWEWMKE